MPSSNENDIDPSTASPHRVPRMTAIQRTPSRLVYHARVCVSHSAPPSPSPHVTPAVLRALIFNASSAYLFEFLQLRGLEKSTSLGTSPVAVALTMTHALATACFAPPAVSLRSTKRVARRGASRSLKGATAEYKHEYTVLERDTKAPGISLHDITSDIKQLVKQSGITNGHVNVLSRHTTTAVTINEAEPRLMDDVRIFLKKLAPPDDFYLHNDLQVREAPENWPGGDDDWRAQEPENCHSHLLSMLIGNSETIPVVNGELTLGTWQSVMLVELYGPRTRTVGVQVAGVGE